MNKMILGAVALALLSTVSCKKSKSNDSTPSNEWKVGSTTYKASSVVNNTMGLTAVESSNSNNSIVFAFSGGTPTTDGTFTVSNSTNTPGTVTVVAYDAATMGVYNVKSGTVTVKVKSGKVSVSLPASPAEYVGMTTKDNVDISANLSEK